MFTQHKNKWSRRLLKPKHEWLIQHEQVADRWSKLKPILKCHDSNCSLGKISRNNYTMSLRCSVLIYTNLLIGAAKEPYHISSQSQWLKLILPTDPILLKSWIDAKCTEAKSCNESEDKEQAETPKLFSPVLVLHVLKALIWLVCIICQESWFYSFNKVRWGKLGNIVCEWVK